VPLRVHVDIVASTQMLVDGEEVLLLPAMTRYEQPGGGTETTTERRIVFSPRIEGPKDRPDGPGEVRAEWDILLELARRVDPSRAHLLGCEDAQAIREEIARVVPAYAGIEQLRDTGDQVQWGGERLCDGWRFPTPDGKARFVPVTPQEATLPPGRFRLSTRRGKQFNSMVWRDTDPITGAGRDALFVSPRRGAARGRRGRRGGGPLGDRRGPRPVKLAALRDGNVQMFFPEANPLLDPTRRDPVGLVPDYNAEVAILPVRVTGARSPAHGCLAGPRRAHRRSRVCAATVTYRRCRVLAGPGRGRRCPVRRPAEQCRPFGARRRRPTEREPGVDEAIPHPSRAVGAGRGDAMALSLLAAAPPGRAPEGPPGQRADVGPCDPIDDGACLLPFPNDRFTAPPTPRPACGWTCPSRACRSTPAACRSTRPSGTATTGSHPARWPSPTSRAWTCRRPSGCRPGSRCSTGRTLSLAPDAPIVLLDLDTGARVPYLAELDHHPGAVAPAGSCC
jgi:hypothetical protein